MGATVSDPLDWDVITLHSKFASQSEESYEEQHLAIQTSIGAIDSHRLTLFQDAYTKNVGIRGFPGGGKIWCMIYCALYAVSKGLRVIITTMMSKRSLQLGGLHWHKIFMLPIEKNLTPHKTAELAIIKLLQNPKKVDLIKTMNIFFCDEMGQVSAEMLATIDIILRRVRNSRDSRISWWWENMVYDLLRTLCRI